MGEMDAKKGDCKLSFLSFFCSFFISSGNIEQKPAQTVCSRLLQIVPVMLNYFSISYIYVYIHLMFSCENISFVCVANSPTVHVNGYSFRFDISCGNISCHSMFSCENISFVHFVNSSLFMYYVHSPYLQRKP